MKKSASLFLAALMVVSMAALTACGEGDTNTTAGSGSASGNVTTSKKPSAPASNPDTTKPAGNTTGEAPISFPPPVLDDSAVLVAPTAKFHYKVFECQYSGTGAGGEYLTDDLADYMASFGWNLGDETLPQEALADILTWEEAEGPFGTVNGTVGYDTEGNELYNNPDVDWTDQNHGLICATTFTIENLEAFKQKYDEVIVTFWYDNTPSVYLNGRLVMYKNTELAGDPHDWVDSFNWIDEDDVIFDPLGEDTLMDCLKEGENTIVIVLKDAWGGRECCFELDAEA